MHTQYMLAHSCTVYLSLLHCSVNSMRQLCESIKALKYERKWLQLACSTVGSFVLWIWCKLFTASANVCTTFTAGLKRVPQSMQIQRTVMPPKIKTHKCFMLVLCRQSAANCYICPVLLPIVFTFGHFCKRFDKISNLKKRKGIFLPLFFIFSNFDRSKRKAKVRRRKTHIRDFLEQKV